MAQFNDNQVFSLERMLCDLLPEIVEVTDVGSRTHGMPGYIAYLELDNGDRATVVFNARLLEDSLEDLDIYDVCGFFSRKVDQSIFVDEPKVDY